MERDLILDDDSKRVWFVAFLGESKEESGTDAFSGWWLSRHDHLLFYSFLKDQVNRGAGEDRPARRVCIGGTIELSPWFKEG